LFKYDEYELVLQSAMSRSQAREHRKNKLIESVKELNKEKGVHGVLVTSENCMHDSTSFVSRFSS